MERGGVERRVVEAMHGIGERRLILGPDQHACHAVLDGLARPAAAQGDHRPATGLCLDGRDPEVLLPGQEERACASIEVAQLMVKNSVSTGG